MHFHQMHYIFYPVATILPDVFISLAKEMVDPSPSKYLLTILNFSSLNIYFFFPNIKPPVSMFNYLHCLLGGYHII